MKNRKIAILTLCFGYFVFANAFSQQLVLPAFTGSSYTNSLKDQSSIDSDFIGDYSYERDDYNAQEQPLQNATFKANQSTGLELISQTPFTAQGSKVFFQSLPANQNWQVDVKAHISNFSKLLQNPYYYAGLTFGKINDTVVSSNAYRVNLNFTRSLETSTYVPQNNFENTINSGIYSNDDPGTPPFVLIPNEDLYLRVTYDSVTMSCTHYYSLNGNTYTSFKSYYLKDVWGLSPSDRFWINLVGTSIPYQSQAEFNLNPSSNYNLASGQLYLSDFKITIDNSSSSNNNSNTSSTSSNSNSSSSNIQSSSSNNKKFKKMPKKGSLSSSKKSQGASKKLSSNGTGKKISGKKKKKK
jgi:hypothetical protein